MYVVGHFWSGLSDVVDIFQECKYAFNITSYDIRNTELKQLHDKTDGIPATVCHLIKGYYNAEV